MAARLGRWWVGAVAGGLLACAVPGTLRAEAVDLELVLLADASGSIDEAEIRFERESWAEALSDPAILAAIAGGYRQRIAVAYVEWGMASSQDVVVPWTVIDGSNTASAFGEALLSAPRRAYGMNAIGSALSVAHGLIADPTHAGDRRVIDISADSARSWGGVPIQEARAAALADGITINGLAIACREADCSGRPYPEDVEAEFAARIIGGPASFVISAENRERFMEAARQKLIQEIAEVVRAPRELASLRD